MGAREPEKPTPPLTQVRREGYGLPSRSYAGGIIRWAGRKAGQRGGGEMLVVGWGSESCPN